MQQARNTTQQADPNAWHRAIESSKEKFTGSGLVFDQEQIFATQMLMNNSYLLDTAKSNPTSLKMAMYNVSAVGLTLNPNQGLAYLVPRRPKKGEAAKIMLDISYRGLIAIGVEAGAILCAKAELVCKNDEHFAYKSAFQEPDHVFDPFLSQEDRGTVRGGYCVAVLRSGRVLVEAMSRSDMDKIKNSSEAFIKGVGPWIDWEDQMQLKSIVKRAYKWWPQPSQRMATALKILNEDNGEGLASISRDVAAVGFLPPPPPREMISTPIQNSVRTMVNHAKNIGGFEACKELMENRFKNPQELSFALYELESAKTEYDALQSVNNEIEHQE
jgi:recombination protein RecT